jgi:hypothetical protein
LRVREREWTLPKIRIELVRILVVVCFIVDPVIELRSQDGGEDPDPLTESVVGIAHGYLESERCPSLCFKSLDL